jgi:hypothetical protein
VIFLSFVFGVGFAFAGTVAFFALDAVLDVEIDFEAWAFAGAGFGLAADFSAFAG